MMVTYLGRIWLPVTLLLAASAAAQAPSAPAPGFVGFARFSAPLPVPSAFIAPSTAHDPFSAADQTQRSQSSPYEHASRDDDRYGSPFVSMDSWIYPALERLSALGLIPTQSVSIRPWTRQECRRQVRSAEDLLYGFGSLDVHLDGNTRTEAERVLNDLESVLKEPNGDSSVVLDSVYTRVGGIAGPALTDGFHYGQTWWNDYGRPLGSGASAIAGYQLRANSGRFFLGMRQEVQTAPSTPAVTQARADFFNSIDNAPFVIPAAPTIPTAALILPAPGRDAYVRQRPLAMYAGVAFSGYALSFGKQEIYWGPTTLGPWAFSSNAEPTYNLRFMASRPHGIPFISDFAKFRVDLVIGKLSGHQRPARPYFNGIKVDFLLGRNLELSFTRWSILWGVGHPMTLGNLKRNLFSSNSTGTSFAYGDRGDPGDRKSGFDFRWHVPGVAQYLTVYGDGYADDEVNPLAAPRRSIWQTGAYLARLPYVSRADLRFEMASSEELSQDEGGTRDFINNQYRDGNTNKGFLLGNAVGRDGRTFEGRLGVWFTGRTRVEAGYRQTKLSSNFLPKGGTISDPFLQASYAWSREWQAQAFAQYERFLVPSFQAERQNNGSVRVQITWTPHRKLNCKAGTTCNTGF